MVATAGSLWRSADGRGVIVWRWNEVERDGQPEGGRFAAVGDGAVWGMMVSTPVEWMQWKGDDGIANGLIGGCGLSGWSVERGDGDESGGLEMVMADEMGDGLWR